MYRLFFSILLLITFFTSQSFALVCGASCSAPQEISNSKDHSEMPDCHSTEKKDSSKDISHSCSSLCQSDYLESQYFGLERNFSELIEMSGQTVTDARVFFMDKITILAKRCFKNPPEGIFESLFLIQQKILV